MRMKAAMMVLGLLAAAKITAQEYLYRSGTRDVLVRAYRDHAIAACQKDTRLAGVAITVGDWSEPDEIRLVIGRSDLDVAFWQIDHDQWSARYRNPHLLLASTDRRFVLQCNYDIVQGAAKLSRG